MTGAGTGRGRRDDALVVDLHVHAPDFVPQPFRALWRGVTPRRPARQGFDVLAGAGVDAVLAKAVGDPIVTRCYVGRRVEAAVEAQLAGIEAAAGAAGLQLAGSIGDVQRAADNGRCSVLLGVEGGDFLGPDVDAVDRWWRRGVRAVVLVHLGDNQLGTTCLPWQHYAGPVPVRRRRDRGLTALGVRVVRRMNELGILVDVAHADRATLLGVTEVATAPVVSTHTGARALQDFPRFLADDEIRAIASTGGLVGLWPFRSHGRGVRDVTDLVAHARHVAELVGPQHVAIGTDMNGVPGYMAGYRGERDLPGVARALGSAGFSAAEVGDIFGRNAVRVLATLDPEAG